MRSFEARRAAVDVLKELQTYDAYEALLSARPTLVSQKASYDALGQALMDDVIRRLDAACNPYFR